MEKGFKYNPNITSEEIGAVSNYKGLGSVGYNCALYDGIEAEETYIYENPDPFSTMVFDNPTKVIAEICNLYSVIYKMSKLRESNETITLYRGTSEQDVAVMNKSNVLKKFLSTSTHYDIAENRFALPWKKPAVMHIEVPSDVPRVTYTSLNGIQPYKEINDYNEKEVLIAPFCNVEINPYDKGFWVSVNGQKRPQYYDVKVTKMQLQEISPEQEAEGLKYLTENAAKCKEYAEKLLDDTYAKEQFDLVVNIRLINESITEMRKDGNERYTRFIEEDKAKIADLNEQIRKLDEEAKIAKEEVEKFKKHIMPICMSRCRAIERKIDLDYDIQKNEFMHRQNDVELQNKIKYREELVNRSRAAIGLPLDSYSFKNFERVYYNNGDDNLAYKQENYLIAIKRRKERIQSIADHLGIPYYEYLKNIDELIGSNDVLKKKYGEMVPSINKLDAEEIDNIPNEELNQVDRIVSNLENNNSSYETLSSAFYHKQNAALLASIYDKILIKKSEMHEDNLRGELAEINSRSTLDRAKDFFTRNSKEKKLRMNEIERAIPLIVKRKEELIEKINNPSTEEDINPEVVYNELKQIKGQFNILVYTEMKEFIENCYNLKDVDENNVRSTALEQADIARLSQKEQMDLFLKSNGYVESENESKINPYINVNEHKVDELTQKAMNIIQKNRDSASLVDEFTKVTQSEPQKKEQTQEMRGMGSGFNIVR